MGEGRYGSAGKVLAVQAGKPEFRPSTSDKSGSAVHVCELRVGKNGLSGAPELASQPH